MPVLRRGDRLVVASHNPGKVREIEALLSPFGVATVGAAEFGLAEPEETGATFAANAALKAEAATFASGLPALADDSGLEVAGLGGAPGIHSARWAGPDRDFAVAMQRVEDELGRLGDDRFSPPRDDSSPLEGEVRPHRGGRGGGYSGTEPVEPPSPPHPASARRASAPSLHNPPPREGRADTANFVCVLALARPGEATQLFEGKVFGRLTFPARGRKGFGYDPIFVPDGGTLTFGEMEPDAKHAVSHRARAFALFRDACLRR